MTEADATAQSRLLASEVPTCGYGATAHRDACERDAEYVLDPVGDDYGEVYRCSSHRDDGPIGMWGAELAFERRRLDDSDVTTVSEGEP